MIPTLILGAVLAVGGEHRSSGRFDRAQDVGVGLVRRDDQDPGLRQRREYPPRRRHAIDFWDPQSTPVPAS
ncbi:hypothetical protein AWC32_00070 [Mycobacterium xenopi]|nr:hypothetical protein AWC32_00070 [Mycobacterium xenopi]